ncbi:uncharacterized protein EV422DRAFT_536491 [Fimicolochytrium jonesii]|uniref:uncharacterized protein n=1 Tax=Fimicolochytrium jonesii TaxID=1396493 RepID=UPI0022FF160D|nr:uncharacterized protein EV422DRAFT_536491 [Fimicolochytrium jonesii]KAI8818683.1 hypothetical protein EV422DRAFT_536491 [Fimicolochytrium jonesii]
MGALDKFLTHHFGGIPKSFKDLEWIIRTRPDVPPIMVSADEYRSVTPGSQPTYQPYKNEKLSKNYYFTRDYRRAYPQTVVYTSAEISGLLPPGIEVKSIAASSETGELSSVSQNAAYTASKLPPLVDRKYRWKPAMPHLKPDAVNSEYPLRGAT